MTPRVLKRLEALLRTAAAFSSTSENERKTATTEALRIVVEARCVEAPIAWQQVVVLRYETCFQCGGDINPATRVYRRAGSYLHSDCYAERYAEP